MKYIRENKLTEKKRPMCPQTSFQTNEAVLKMIGLHVVDTILVTGSGDPNTAANNKEILLKAYEAGKGV